MVQASIVCAANDRPDQLIGLENITQAPAGSVELFATGTDGKRARCYGGVESGRAGGGLGVAEVLVDFVRQEDEGVGYEEGAQCLKFLRCEDFAERVMAGHGYVYREEGLIQHF